MRGIATLAIFTLIAGCASEPVAPPAPVPQYEATQKPAATTLEEAQKLGYTIVNEDGQKLYCREERKLGSHIQKDRTCLTEQELLASRDFQQRNFDNMKKYRPPPAGK